MTKRSAQLILTTILLGGCTTQKETVYQKEVVYDSGKQNVGGTDSGGGNGFQGKPLESYRFDIRTLPEFPVVEKLALEMAKIFPQLASDLYHISYGRRWYRIPGSLAVIPSERIGVAFPTDQLALQNLGEIWLDGKLFDKMDLEARAILILHELVMGIRLMQFQDSADRCLAGIALKGALAITDEEKALYQDDRKNCYKQASVIPGVGGGNGGPTFPIEAPTISLASKDYENIRELVSLVWLNSSKLDAAELRLWLKDKGFRTYSDSN